MAKVLIADDDPTVRHVLLHILEVQGHTAWEVSDGDGAVHAASMQEFDLVIMDLTMRRKNGVQAVRDILRAKPGQKVAFVSETVMLGARGFCAMANSHGAYSVLTKPFTAPDVSRAVKQALSCGATDQNKKGRAD